MKRLDGSLGVDLRLDFVVGKTRTIDRLQETFDAIFVGAGAGLPWFLEIPGENLNGVYSANEYLTRCNLMRGFRFPAFDTPLKRSARVAVFGGGSAKHNLWEGNSWDTYEGFDRNGDGIGDTPFTLLGYAGRVWHKEAVRRFTAISGEATRAAAAARVRLLQLRGSFGGRWPHSLAVQPGGVSKALDKGERMRALAVLAEFRAFLESRIFGDSLERVAALDSRAALSAWMTDGPASDFRFFLTVAGDLDLAEWGKGPPRFVSLGAAGDLSGLTEDVSHAWLGGASLHPAGGVTQPEVDKADGYSWCKAPRLDGQSGETGALARQLAAGQPLLTELVAAAGGRGSVLSRVVARVIELAQLVMAMEGGLRRLGDPGAWCVTGDAPASAGGVGLVEAARGSLGHWLSVEQGRIARYQVVAPTTWNFSPRDTQGNPGPLEEALVGVPIEVPAEMQMDEQPPLVNHIVRSFDPGMSCTVH